MNLCSGKSFDAPWVSELLICERTVMADIAKWQVSVVIELHVGVQHSAIVHKVYVKMLTCCGSVLIVAVVTVCSRFGSVSVSVRMVTCSVLIGLDVADVVDSVWFWRKFVEGSMVDAFCRHFYCLNTDVQYTGRQTASNSCDCPLRQHSIVTSNSCIFPCDQFVNLSHFVSFLKSIDISMHEAMVSQGFHKHRSQGDNISEIYLLEGGQFVRFLKSIEISK